MTDREKLTELVEESFADQHDRRRMLTVPDTVNHLLANGVVVREKGEWEVEWRVDCVDPFGDTLEVPVAICPKCGEEEYATAYDEYWAKPSNFCPNCGADMRKVENNNA